MTPIIWSKFFWSEWAADHKLRACTLEARGLWLELLCIAAPRGGYLVDDDEPLTTELIAAMLREPVEKVAALMAELEAKKVFLRDAKGRIYAPRLLRDANTMRSAREGGKKGGRASHEKQKGIFARPATPPDLKSQESEVRSHESKVIGHESAATAPDASPEPTRQAPPRIAPLVRAVELMGTTLDALHRKQAWLTFDYTFACWCEEGCDPERDIWPTLSALTAKRGGRVPASPAYFAEAVREARDRRLSARAAPPPRRLGAPYLTSTALIANPTAATRVIDPQTQADRLAVFTTTGKWSSQWGPRPEAQST